MPAAQRLRPFSVVALTVALLPAAAWAGRMPVLTVTSGTTTFTEGDPNVLVVPAPGTALSFSQPDTADATTPPAVRLVQRATVAITSGFASGQDELLYTTVGLITGSFDAGTGVLTLTGAGTSAEYQTALRSIQFRNQSLNPVGGNRTITFSVRPTADYLAASGHYYEFIQVQPPAAQITRTAALAAAGGSTYWGLQGYLATITSAAENAYLANFLAPGLTRPAAWFAAENSGPGLPAPCPPDPFFWGAGPEAGQPIGSYTNWHAGEPNNGISSCDERYTEMLGNNSGAPGALGQWNDIRDSGSVSASQFRIGGYFVEYGGMAGDPVLQLDGTRTVFVDPVNNPPVAGPDSVAAIRERTLDIPVATLLANDTDPDDTDLTITAVASPSAHGGTVSLLTGLVRYQPPTGFDGGDTFTYTLSDPHGLTATGTVTVTVAPWPTLSIQDATTTAKRLVATALGFAVTVSPTPALGEVVQVDYETLDASALSGVDYTATSGTLTFGPTVTAANVQVEVLPDAVSKGTETLALRLSNPKRVVLSRTTATGTILDSGRFFTLTPCRLLDTRLTNAPLGPGETRTIPFVGVCGLPATAYAASLNLTITQPTGPGSLVAYPAGQAPPLASFVNWTAGQTRPNNALVALGQGQVTVRNASLGTTHLIIDVNGYFE
jgi:hypothetical protein